MLKMISDGLTVVVCCLSVGLYYLLGKQLLSQVIVVIQNLF